MGKPVIVFADVDESYLIPLELQFLEEFGDRIDLELITQEAYFLEYFITAKQIDVLVVGERWYNSQLQRHNITNIFFLTERDTASDTGSSNVIELFKYSAIRDIYFRIITNSSGAVMGALTEKKETQVVLVYSPIGGSGKTTLALGLCGHLHKRFKRVLYLNAEHLNGFQHYFPGALPLPANLYDALRTGGTSLYQAMEPFLAQGDVPYFPPFRVALSSLDFPLSVYQTILSALRKSGEYDVIIVDVDTAFDEDKAMLIRNADKVVLLATQTPAGVAKMNQLVQNMSCGNKEKFYFLCNLFNPSLPNALDNPELELPFTISEYIPYDKHIDNMTVQNLANCAGIARVAYLLE